MSQEDKIKLFRFCPVCGEELGIPESGLPACTHGNVRRRANEVVFRLFPDVVVTR